MSHLNGSPMNAHQLISRTTREWFQFSFSWEKVEMPGTQTDRNGDLAMVEVDALVLIDPRDGSQQRFYFTLEGKQELLRRATGGVVVPG